MSSAFRRSRSGAVTVRLEPVDAAVLAHLVEQVVMLLGDGELAGAEPAGAEPAGGVPDPLLAALGPGFGQSSTSVRPPTDEVLARLLPDGYRDDPEAAAEFRRFTEHDLRSRKIAAAKTVLETIASAEQGGGKIILNSSQANDWLGLLNDLRLAVGIRLDVSEDYHDVVAGLADDDPRLPMYEVYEWLTFMQDSLVDALMGEL